MLLILTSAAFLVFAQAFMIAPILPRLGQVFGVNVGFVGLAVPAYLIPYGVLTLLWGPLAERFGKRVIILICTTAFVVLTAATATAPAAGAFILWRVAAGVAASGIVPVGVSLIGDLIPYQSRGHALGWMFGGMAGGMAVGSTVGALGEPSIGWRGLFVVAAGFGIIVIAALVATVPSQPRPVQAATPREVVAGYVHLLQNSRARRTYTYITLNAVLHSGIYTWLGLYLHQRFDLGPIGIGLALLGYGIPGFLFGPLIGRLADRYGRARLIPAGVAVGALAAFGLAVPIPLAAAAVLVTTLSLGYDLTQPLLAGIVTDLPGHPSQAVALMALVLFSGFGAGSLIFQAALNLGFAAALSTFGAVALFAAVLAVPTFNSERARTVVLEASAATK